MWVSSTAMGSLSKVLDGTSEYSPDSPFLGSPRGTPKGIRSLHSMGSLSGMPDPYEQFKTALTHNRNEIAMILSR